MGLELAGKGRGSEGAVMAGPCLKPLDRIVGHSSIACKLSARDEVDAGTGDAGEDFVIVLEGELLGYAKEDVNWGVVGGESPEVGILFKLDILERGALPRLVHNAGVRRVTEWTSASAFSKVS